MSATFDAYASGGISASVSSLSWTHTPVGTPTKILVSVLHSSDQAAPTSVTYGGNAMTLLVSNTAAWQTALRVYALNSPPSGAQTVAITMPTTNGRLGGGSVSILGSTTTTTTNNTNHDGVPPSNTISSATGDIVFTFAGGTLAISSIATPNHTGLWSDTNSNASHAAQYTAGAASVTNSWSSSVTGETAAISVNVNQATSSNYTLAVDSTGLTLQGQSLGTNLAMSVTAGQVALHPSNITTLFDQAYVLPVTHTPLTVEGQEVPFILTQPGTHGQLAFQGQTVNLSYTASYTMPVTAAELAFSTPTITIALDSNYVLTVDAGQLVLGGQVIGLATPYLGTTNTDSYIRTRRTPRAHGLRR